MPKRKYCQICQENNKRKVLYEKISWDIPDYIYDNFSTEIIHKIISTFPFKALKALGCVPNYLCENCE